jgi:hypothetical protein
VRTSGGDEVLRASRLCVPDDAVISEGEEGYEPRQGSIQHQKCKLATARLMWYGGVRTCSEPNMRFEYASLLHPPAVSLCCKDRRRGLPVSSVVRHCRPIFGLCRA